MWHVFGVNHPAKNMLHVHTATVGAAPFAPQLSGRVDNGDYLYKTYLSLDAGQYVAINDSQHFIGFALLELF